MTMEKPARSRRKTKVARFEASRLDMLISGELKVEDLTDEEIRRQQLMNSQGDFRGRPPLWVPREMATAFMLEHNRRFDLKMMELQEDAFRAHKEILNSRHLQPGDGTRMQGVKEVYERTRGKVVQGTESHVVVDKGKSWDDFIEDAIIDVEAEDAEEIEG